ncbi:prenyltransferase [Leptobacterium flavescens]|uniref:Prenyltransferase n=1 Tax=Leptobacterium flavescens TaxID=472055 RepID=A0A6P0UT54_9FLAO|nr:geranylgeranylglycerol-phosphate geranylgeranyltransferase [Leptobacterium flavescens]NER14033.1 prenyltransferase [Leptobacterium flavescens]
MMRFLNLIRYPNLIIIGLTQVLFKHFLIDSFFRETALSNMEFGMLVLATLCIAAGGNIINDIQDQEIDQVNRPAKRIVGRSISEKQANNAYLILTFAGVALGFYISNLIGKSGFAVLFVMIAGLLYFYATTIKQILIINNLLVSLLVAASILIIGIFDVLPLISETNEYVVKYLFRILLIYSAFAFFINFMREIIKDIEDVDGDYTHGIRTLPIILGKERTVKVVCTLSLLPLAGVFYFVYTYLFENRILVIYFLFLLMAPLFYFLFSGWEAKKRKDFATLSMILKLLMVFGVLSIIPVHYYILKGI